MDDGSAYLAQVGPAGASKRCSHSRLEDTKPSISQTLKQITKAPREGASFITSQSELGVIWGGGGASWEKPRCQRGLFWARFRSFWVSGCLDVQRKNRPLLMLLMLAWACRLMLLMLVVSWPRCACVSSILALGVLQHVCLSMFGEKLVCWVNTCFTCRSLCLARS